MDYAQRHQAAQDATRLSFDKNKDEVLKTANFSLMERFLGVGVKDPYFFLQKDYGNCFPCFYQKVKKCL